MDTTSASLLVRVRHLGDVEAWTRFVRTYSPVLHGWARHMGLQHDDAVDLVQDVFAVLVQKLPEFNYDSHKRFRGWLWTVTRRRWVERRRRAVLPLDPGRDPNDVPAPAPPVPELDEAEFRAYMLKHVVPTLRGNFHDSTWRAFWKHVVEGRPVAEVAGEEGLSVAAVYKAKLRVTASLQKALADLVTD
ncbi:rna polymerase sigma70 : RNA polymerase sigma factor, sigma-70 family OS=Singulisphaera acidiphila (strain ATCC BAA-1392 / DSM 18658 / VKM B-2454 / MOB10) GN=Sinac_4755 PE=4 SV=1: Sigma70_r2 [Gemmataceae bacterium]|nr:rna polymerase sigma70 : RNA polymerase sigma factor, sigma-70 family OS=Singulisphaera acidiphila (strain ATCC BAA-1392 / DSM 18658 / VKM B-2454 / MOB10) GN=Sinac_4755 PE=4 SV=1: Sigma70_r2 [Gemmataceae bacterium]VTT98385.1 rna polymerase sigma70 : RNA polymerase sigma factor, sigma-70 family OS=Singulisphaera acidiphila (strain ATCC BAA-1392 / DSM 18658 / VKM B-2454 / MOB10) GN=Sinac_4755 PE=4 SV=1: Sigma70_r2 [Gemmataceae bacterium]